MRALAAVVALGVLLAWCASPGNDPLPEGPARGDGSRSFDVHTTGELRAALAQAQPGDSIVLEAGAVFTGPIALPAKEGDGWITIRTSAADAQLPPGARVSPAKAPLMPKIESGSGPAIRAEPGSHHYRFIGIEVRPEPGAFLVNLVLLGSTETSLDQLSHHIVFERCYLHGDAERGARRGIAMNSGHVEVLDSYLSDFKVVGADSQALAAWNGSGPFRILNNTLEAAGENVMFGGADPSIPGLVPSDIEVRHNHFRKPLSWKTDEPTYAGTPWTVKNLFELKNARRVRIEGNLFERHWRHAQSGYAILFTVRNQERSAPWVTVEDVVFSNNVVREVAQGINLLGRDDVPSGRAQRIVIRNNLFYQVGGERWGGGGTWLLMQQGTIGVSVEHNTALHTGNVVTADLEPHQRFVFRNNIAVHNAYGIVGSGTGPGKPTLDRYFPGAVVERNVIVGGSAPEYPPDNFFPPSLALVGFVDPARGDLRLLPGSPYRGAGIGGKDVGVDFEELLAALGTTAVELRQ